MSINRGHLTLHGEPDTDNVSQEEAAPPEVSASYHDTVEWLSPSSHSQDSGTLNKSLAVHTAGTSRWVFSTKEWQQWYQDKSRGLLWIKGISGSGKSILAAYLAQELGQHHDPVLFFFFRRVSGASSVPRVLLCNFLAQILPQSPQLQARINRYMKTNCDSTSIPIGVLWKWLHLGLHHQRKAYLVIDGLDEMNSENEEFICALGQLGNWQPSNIKVLLISRPVPVIETALQNFRAVQVELAEDYVNGDISIYILRRLDSSVMSPEVQTSVHEAISSRANGSFLYAKLVMDRLMVPGTKVEDILGTIPKNLEALLIILLTEQATHSQFATNLQATIFHWVTYAMRPLRLLEISQIIFSTQKPFAECSLEETKSLIRSSCSPLIEILPDESLCFIHRTITEFLADETRSPLLAATGETIIPAFEAGSTHLALAKACLQYLHLIFSNGPHDRPHENTSSEFYARHPFSSYAAANWKVHLSRAIASGVSKDAAADVYKTIDKIMLLISNERGCLRIFADEWDYEGVSSIHVAAWAGLQNYVATLLVDNIGLLNLPNGHGSTPLIMAAKTDSVEVVELLLGRMADRDLPDYEGQTPLHIAAEKGSSKVIRTLLNAGADPLATKSKPNEDRYPNALNSDSIFSTALCSACQYGGVDILAEFLPFLDSDGLAEAMAVASVVGTSDAVRLILNNAQLRVDTAFKGDSALFLACRSQNYEVVESLLDAGADPNMYCSGNTMDLTCTEISVSHHPLLVHIEANKDTEISQFTPLHAFIARAGYRDKPVDVSLAETLRLLLRAGGDVSATDSAGQTPLHYACALRNTSELNKIIDILLEAGSDPNFHDHKGQTPFHISLKDSEPRTIRSLVEKGKADVDRKDGNGDAPLIHILSADSSTTHNPISVLKFLRYKPDCAVTDTEGNSPLHILFMTGSFSALSDLDRVAASAGSSAEVRPITPAENLTAAFLTSGISPNVRNGKGQTPLHVLRLRDAYALHETSFEIERRLIVIMTTAGADLEAKDLLGRTMLFENLIIPDAVQMLLSVGCQITARDFSGRTLLHEAVKGMANKRSCLAVLNMLIANGLDPHLVDHSGNTLFHELAISRNANYMPETLKQLQAMLSPDQCNYAGQTPLHTAASMNAPDRISRNKSAFDQFLKLCEVKSAPDDQGFTPLHVAAAVSDYYVDRLLEEGAHAFLAAENGLTSLHVACKARQSNAVGLICEHIQSLFLHERNTFINAKDKNGWTALHYACRSGRPESVDFLLSNGAQPNLPDARGILPVLACAEFVEEQSHWPSKSSEHTVDRFLQLDGSLSVFGQLSDSAYNSGQDSPRPWLRSEHDNARIDEIIDKMVIVGGDALLNSSHIENVLSMIIEHAHFDSYTYSCLSRLRSQPSSIDSLSSRSVIIASGGVNVKYEGVHHSAELASPGEFSEEYLSFLLHTRQYDLVRQLFHNLDPDAMQTCKRVFATWGYADLLREALEFPPSSSSQGSTGSTAPHAQNPMLILACERQICNVEVIKVLAEQYGVDLNEQCMVFESNGISNPEPIPGNTALHVLARGSNWWQAAQGIPALLDAGADINSRNSYGVTPLHVALGCYGMVGSNKRKFHEASCFGKLATKILILRGADINATTSIGETCLSMARDDEVITMLLENGAKRSVSALFGAIERSDPKSLERLLAAGIDPNEPAIRASVEKEHDVKSGAVGLGWIFKARQGSFRVFAEELYPLYYAAAGRFSAINPSSQGHAGSNSHDLVHALLAHGANPLLTFRIPSNKYASINRHGPAPPGEDFIKQTIIHSVIYDRGYVDGFLELPGLDLDVRDEKGRTLLLAACFADRNPWSSWATEEQSRSDALVQRLLDQGANVRAQDADGNNALHLLSIHRRGWQQSNEIISVVIQKAPELINQPNSQGESPFYVALQRKRLHLVRLFLGSGADVFSRDAAGNTPLHHLVRIKHRHEEQLPGGVNEILEEVTGRGIDINSRNDRGQSILHVLVFQWSILFSHLSESWGETQHDIAEEKAELTKLIEAGADIFIRDGDGRSLLHIVAASRPGQDGRDQFAARMFACLMELGLDPLAENTQQATSLDVAAASRNTGILKLF